MAELFKESLRILLLGNGGREHALAWKLSQSSRVESIFALPGNGGTASCLKVTNVASVPADDFPGLVAFAKANGVNLVVPGPEAPLVDGVEQYFRKAGIRCFGPSPSAAQLEGSKTFAKDFMKKHGIPTAAYRNFSDCEAALEYLNGISHQVVVKATGLAAGKGVVMPTTVEEAKAAVRDMMIDKVFGHAGDEIVIEEFLEGQELSILTFSDGSHFRSLPMAQDHKRICDGDQGPNTGGMGCYAPTPISTKELVHQVERDVLEPTFRGMRQDKMPFVGCLFTGLMITKDGPRVLEYNVRFGDPETQTVLPLLTAETDLADILTDCVAGTLDTTSMSIRDKFSTTVVVAAGGYPGSYKKGTAISVNDAPDGVVVFHAGTSLSGDQLVTNGGRVIAVNAIADTLEAAVEKAYSNMGLIQFDAMFFRKDIAHRALDRYAHDMDNLTYAKAGVDIDAGNELVRQIKSAVASTKIPGSDGEIGGFGGELNLSPHVKCDGCGTAVDVSIVAAIDGVGTKLLVAQAMQRHDTVGIDLVAMNVNDLIVQGAVPMMFLDYFACGKLDVPTAASFVDGVASGCRQSNSVLVGGETAEMPGLYHGAHYDAAGCSVGLLVPQNRLPRLDQMVEGDIVLGLASSGLHSNGFSLVHKVLTSNAVAFSDPAPWDSSTTVGESLLKPTRIYASILGLTSKRLVKGLAHITGGGLVENPPRMLPSHLAAEIDLGAWDRPPEFAWLQKSGSIAGMEMCKAFNNGVGMMAVVAADKANEVMTMLQSVGETVWVVGRLVPRPGGASGCTFINSWN